MATLLTVATEAHVIRKIGRSAFVQCTDNDEDGIPDDSVSDDTKARAYGDLLFRLRGVYSETSLASSPIALGWLIIFWAYQLYTQRANAPSDWMEAEYQRVAAMADAAGLGQQIPGVALSGNHSPTMSNLTVDQRHRRSTIRVTPSNSTDTPTTLSQDTTHDYPSFLD